MEVYEITGYQTGVSRSDVNFLQPADSFEDIQDGYIYRGVLQSRKGFSLFAPRLDDNSRVHMITTFLKPDGTAELLAADANYLYKYNVGTRQFDQIAFGGSMAAYGGFSISDKAAYISGTAYPDKNNNPRFVFTSTGIAANAAGSSVFFYDPTASTVEDYTAVADNADYVAFSGGALQRATHVIWFGERLNFINPRIGGTTYNQGILFSGIRDSSGNGDSYNAPGSGLNQLDTFETIQGASILGNYMALNLSGSNWLIEKTTDAFNPYLPKRIPSVIGCDAPFSFAQWNSKIYSMGRSGVLGMDFRESLRVDNKIPFFTRDEIDANTFNYTFGGFDRVTAQFMWSYKEGPDTDITTQNKALVYNYEEDSWSVFNMPITVISTHDGEETLLWNQIDETIDSSYSQWNTTEEIWNEIGIGNKFQLTLVGDDEGFIYNLNQDYDDKFTDITAITQASSAVLTVDESDFQVGDQVVVQNVEGMTEINNYNPSEDETEVTFYTVTAVTNTSVTLNVNSTNYTAYTSGGTLSKPIFFEATTNPFNPYRDQGRRCFISTIEVLINTNNGFLYVDVYADGDDSPFIEQVLLKPTGTRKDREWVSMVVDQEADFFTFRFSQNSPAVGVKITSIRLHVEAGGLTDG